MVGARATRSARLHVDLIRLAVAELGRNAPSEFVDAADSLHCRNPHPTFLSGVHHSSLMCISQIYDYSGRCQCRIYRIFEIFSYNESAGWETRTPNGGSHPADSQSAAYSISANPAFPIPGRIRP